jgi:putative ABC transport system permease protein
MYEKLGEALIHSQSGHLQVSRAGYHAHGRRSPERFLIEQPLAIQEMLSGMPEVDQAMGRINFSGLISTGRSDWPIIGEGVEPDKESKLGTSVTLIEGRRLGDADKFGMMVGEGVARTLQLRIGDVVMLLVNTSEGALNVLDFEVVGVFQTFSKDFDARAVRITLEAARELLVTSGSNSVVVALKRTSDTEHVAKTLATQLEPRGLEIKTWQELNDFYASTVALYQRQFGVLQLIMLLLVLLSVANSVNMSVFERVGEFGTMRSLGNRTRDIVRLIFTESALLGVIGSLVGALLGVVLAMLISAIGIPMPPMPNSNRGYVAQIQVVPEVVVMAIAVGVVATVLAAACPAIRIRRIPHIDTLHAKI